MEGTRVFSDILWRGAEAVYPENVSEDQTLEWPPWMQRVWGQVKIQILWLFEQGGVDSLSGQSQGKVHIVLLYLVQEQASYAKICEIQLHDKIANELVKGWYNATWL